MLLQDLRFTFRQWRKRPGATAMAVVILALGIGANTAIFSVAHGVLLRPLPYAEPDELVRLWPETTLSPKMLEVFQQEARGFAGITGFSAMSRSLTGTGEPAMVSVAGVSAEHFDILGTQPFLGRGFRPDEAEAGGQGVAVLGHDLWRTRFGGDRDILGRTIELDGEALTVVGVLERGHRPLRAGWQVWTPIVYDRGENSYCCSRHLEMVGRLAPETEASVARAEISRIAGELQQADPRHISDEEVRTASVSLLHDDLVSGVRPTLMLLTVAVALVLLVACANIANLQLVQASARRREMAVRTALGAGHWRVLRQMLTESGLLGLFGGVLGLAVATAAMQVLIGRLPSSVPRISDIAIDSTVLLFALGLSLFASVAFGLAPARQLLRYDLQGSLKDGGHGTSGSRRRWLSHGLVAAQVAASVVLLMGAGLLIRSLWHLQQVDPGFRSDGVLAARLSPPAAAYPEAVQQMNFYEEVRARLAALPGVQQIAFSQNLPVANDNLWIFPFLRPDQPPAADGRLPITRVSFASPEYLSALGIALEAGRNLSTSDVANSQPVLMVNRALTRQQWHGEDAVGRQLQLFNADGPTYEVVGVVADTRQDGLASEAAPEIYIPLAQWPQRELEVILHTSGDPSALVADLRAAVWSVDEQVAIAAVRSLADVVRGSTANPRFLALLVGAFALQTLLLGAAGIYGVMSYLVGQRTAEIGLRMALGAGRGDVERSVIGRGLAIAVIGIVAGLSTALMLTRFMAGVLHGVSATDWPTCAAVVLAVLAMALFSVWWPARRAGRLDPIRALRTE